MSDMALNFPLYYERYLGRWTYTNSAVPVTFTGIVLICFALFYHGARSKGEQPF